MGLGKTTGGKTSIIGYIISQKKRFVNIIFKNFKNGYIFVKLNKYLLGFKGGKGN